MSNMRCIELFLKPHAEQAEALSKQLAACRITANALNEYGRDIITNNAAEKELAETLAKEGVVYEPHYTKFPSQFDFVSQAREVRETNLWMRETYAECTSNVGWDTYHKFQDYFRRRKNGIECGLPRFKSASRYDTFRYSAYGQYELTDELLEGRKNAKIHLGGIGDIIVRNSRRARALLSKGIPKQAIVKRYKGYHKNRWSVIIYYDTVEPVLDCEMREFPGDPVSMDVGARKTAVFSDGRVVENTHQYVQTEEKIARIQRRISDLDEHAPDYKRAKRKLMGMLYHLFDHQRDRKKTLFHQEAKAVVREHPVIILEDLMVTEINNLNDNKHVHKEFRDASPGMFRSILLRKAEEACAEVCYVNPAYTSQTCPVCGKRTDPGSSEVFRCAHCGHTDDRDRNACINLLDRWMGHAIRGPVQQT